MKWMCTREVDECIVCVQCEGMRWMYAVKPKVCAERKGVHWVCAESGVCVKCVQSRVDNGVE